MSKRAAPVEINAPMIYLSILRDLSVRFLFVFQDFCWKQLWMNGPTLSFRREIMQKRRRKDSCYYVTHPLPLSPSDGRL